MAINDSNPLGVVRGAPAIGKTIGATTRRAYYLLESGVLPAVKEGNIWTTTLERLRRFYEADASARSTRRGAS